MRLTVVLLFTASVVKASGMKHVAITQIVEHPSLEQAKKGILDVLAENGYKTGQNLEITEKNAQGSVANALLIAKKFVSEKPDAIVAISTPSAQSVIKATRNSDIPVIFSSVTDPVAAGLVNNIDIAVKNITGATDYPPIDDVIRLMEELFPDAKKVGFLYNAGEANSVKIVSLITEATKDKYEIIDSQVANSNQISQAILSLVGRVDILYIPSDNTVFSAMPKVVQMSREYKLPIISNDPDSVIQGFTVCIGYTQEQVGRTAGKLLVRSLSGEDELKIEKPAEAQIFINKKSASILGMEIPKTLLGMKIEIVGNDND